MQTFRVFSANPDKAWCEKFYLFYSCIWPILFVVWAQSGLFLHVGDIGNNMVIACMALPNVVVPYLYCPRVANKSCCDYYWVKFNVWIVIFSIGASYFYTPYFFDVLGMVYNFPHLHYHLTPVLIGTTGQQIPLMMYTCCWFYFTTYHVLANLIIRTLSSLLSAVCVTDTVSKFVATLIAAWLCAYGELYGTTMQSIDQYFHYKSMDWALKWGACYYALYFIVSFPMVFSMDEYDIDRKEHKQITNKWTLEYTILNALATTTLVLYLLDLFAQFVVTDWKGI